MTTAERRRQRRLTVTASILSGVVLAGCITGPNLPSRSGAGVLTTEDGAQYMVLTPCSSLEVDAIALKYFPPGSTPGDSSAGEVVIAYRTTTSLAASEVVAPLTAQELPPAGLELVERNDELLSEALRSTEAGVLDDFFYVEVNGRRQDGTSGQLIGSWAADMAGRDTVVLNSEVFDEPASRRCGSDDIGWTLPGQRATP